MADWFWFDDKKWVEYDASVSKKLEEGFWSGESKVGTDAQRFVEIVRPLEDAGRVLRENFRRLPARATGAVGMQRRYDDESRRRLVKRVPHRVLAGRLLCVLPDDARTESLRARLVDARAVLCRLPPAKPGVVPPPGVVAIADAAADPADVAHARHFGVPVVTPAWAAKIFADDAVPPTAPFLLPDPAPQKEGQEEKEKDVSMEKEEEEEEEIPAKKRPRDEEVEGVEEKQEQGKKEQEKHQEEQEQPYETTRPLLYRGTELKGTVTYEDGQRVAVVVRVGSVARRGALCDAFEGEMTWVDLHDACTRVRGTLRTAPGTEAGTEAAWATVLRLEEYAVVRGAGEVDVPAAYELRLAADGRTLTGRTTGAAAAADAAAVALEADRLLLPAWALPESDPDAASATCTRFAVAPGQHGLVVPAHARLASTVAAGAAPACAWQIAVTRARQTGARSQVFSGTFSSGICTGNSNMRAEGTLAGTHLQLALGDTFVFEGEWLAGAREYAGVLRRTGGAEEPCRVLFWHALPAQFAVTRAPDALAPCRGRTLRGRVLLPCATPLTARLFATHRPKHIVVRNVFATADSSALTLSSSCSQQQKQQFPGTVSNIDVSSAAEQTSCYAEFHFV